MHYNVVGIRTVNYISKKTGNPVSGVEFHVTFSDKNVNGLATDKIFISSRNLDVSHVKLNDDIQILYNRYGQVDFVEVL